MTLENDEIRSVVSAARMGSEGAYRELVGRFAPSLMGYFYRNTGNRTDAEDLLQDVFLRLLGSITALKLSLRSAQTKLDSLFASLQDRAFRGEL
jgi:DNA-directed RNA polymerase specialized sigma24 family protein